MKGRCDLSQERAQSSTVSCVVEEENRTIQSAVEAGALQRALTISLCWLRPRDVGLLPGVAGVAAQKINDVAQNWFDHSEAFADGFG